MARRRTSYKRKRKTKSTGIGECIVFSVFAFVVAWQGIKDGKSYGWIALIVGILIGLPVFLYIRLLFSAAPRKKQQAKTDPIPVASQRIATPCKPAEHDIEEKQQPPAMENTAVFETPEAETPLTETESEDVQQTINVPSHIDGTKCVYQYKTVPISLLENIDLSAILGQTIRFELVSNHINITVNNQPIGTMEKGKLAEMVEDWLDRDDPIFAVVTAVDDDDYTAAFDLFFYRNEFEHLLRRYPDTKTYKLVGNRRGEMQDHIFLCSRGDECVVRYDYDKEKYIVSCGAFDIGYLPASAAKLVEELSDRSLVIYIADKDSDIEDIDMVWVYIFPDNW